MRLLVTGAFDWQEDELNALQKMGHDVLFLRHEKEGLPCAPDWVEGIIGNGIFLHHPIECFTGLRYIQLTSAGYDRVPMEYVRQHGILIFNARGVYSIPMAEFAVSGVLALYKQTGFFADNQREHRWQKHRTLQELNGKTVCIVGCGSVGTACAERFSAFGCQIIGVDIVPCQSPCYTQGVLLSALDAVLPQSDVVVLTLPLTPETTHLLNAERLAKLKAGATVVNIARGAVLDTVALLAELQCGRLNGVLDVFEDEPLAPDSPLWDMENVLVTPHNSFVGDGNHTRMLNLIYHNLEAVQ